MSAENKPNIYIDSADHENPSARRPSNFKRLKFIGATLAAMLAAELGVVAVAKNSAPVNAEVSPQAMTDLLNTKGDFESSTCPQAAPPSWNQIINDPSFPPIYHCAGDPPPLVNFSGNSAVEVDYTANGVAYTTNGEKYTSSFAVTPDQTITEAFAAAYEINEAGVTVKPQTKITWKDGGGNVTGTNIFSPAHTRGPDTWEQFSKTYGPSGTLIPPNTVSGIIEVGIAGSGGTLTTGIKGLEYIDILQVWGPTPPTPTPTRAISVGGVASQPDIDSLPQTTVTHSTRNTIVEIAGGVTALAGTIAVAEAFRRRNRQS